MSRRHDLGLFENGIFIKNKEDVVEYDVDKDYFAQQIDWDDYNKGSSQYSFH